jgi:hypothetical protein
MVLQGEMMCFLDHASEFIDINRPLDLFDSLQPSLFLWYCYGGNFTLDGVESLLRRGADINSRIWGKTCLHIIVSGFEFGKFNRRGQIEALVYLVRCGADIFWTDMDGHSVSEIAYTNPKGGESSRVGDTWDAVLAELGYDVSEFRYHYPRRAQYEKYYTPTDFMDLWRGKEALCPYYSDDDLPWLCDQFQSGSLEKWHAPWDSDSEGEPDSIHDSVSDSDSDTNSDDSSDGGVLIDSKDDTKAQ